MALGVLPLVESLQRENRTLRASLATLEQRIHTLEQANRQLREQPEQAQHEAAQLREQLEQAQREAAQLREQLEQAQREAARQAAPFRRPEHKKIPDDQKKPPGRKPGHPGFHRPVPTAVDQHVEVALPGCPCCGGPVSEVEATEQFIEEIPPVRPHVTRIVTYKGVCPNCGEVRSQHPLQMSEATGAAKTQVGPRAIALAAGLNKQEGLTTRATCRVLERFSGLKLTPGGLVQALQRAADKMQPAYDQLIKDLRASAAVFVDETSWYMGEPGPWLWTFTTADTTVYKVANSRGHEVPLEMLGPEFPGMLVSDCLATYDPLPYRKHKCVAHHQKAISEALKHRDTTDSSYLKQWQLLMTMVPVLWRHRTRLGEEEFVRQRTHLESWCDRLLAEVRTQPGDVAIQNRLRKQRESLFGCLYEPAAEPTNNRAERSFRWAVMARKLSCGNKTEVGAKCFEVLASLGRTCTDRGRDFVNYLAGCLPMNAAAKAIPPPGQPG
jgi:transposase